MKKNLKEITVHKFKNSDKLTHFAPEWEYIIIDAFMNNVDCKRLSKFLLDKEKEILNIPIENNLISDGETGLGYNSTTSRHKVYNVLNFKDKEISKIEENIKAIHELYLKQLNINLPKELYVQCWVNIMRKNQQIKEHTHGTNSESYLGGHITIQSEKTFTHYINTNLSKNVDPLYDFPIANKIGNITLFKQIMPHYTDTHLGNSERITIAFDLSPFKKPLPWKRIYGH